MTTLYPVISHKFRGPPNSGNGGYTAGLVARELNGASEVTLRSPPPLDRTLDLDCDGKIATLRAGDKVIATGHTTPLDHPALADAAKIAASAPRYAAALELQPNYAGFHTHNFPGCFVCGPERRAGDGLRIFGAPYADGVIAAWCPRSDQVADDGSVDEVYLHAALDCPSYFAFGDTTLVALLGRMHSEVLQRPHVDEPCVILAWPLGQDGRKRHSAALCIGASGQLLARAVNTWIELKGEVPAPTT